MFCMEDFQAWQNIWLYFYSIIGKGERFERNPLTFTKPFKRKIQLKYTKNIYEKATKWLWIKR